MGETRVNEPFVVRAPATSANLGSGFDAAGVALDWWNTLRVEPANEKPGTVVVTNVGNEAETIPAGRDNLLVEAMLRLSETVGRPLPAVKLQLEMGFPLGRGFGSSATGIVVGLLAARELLAADVTSTELFKLASAVEGHPDNVAPCLFGGGRASGSAAHGDEECAASVAEYGEVRRCVMDGGTGGAAAARTRGGVRVAVTGD